MASLPTGRFYELMDDRPPVTGSFLMLVHGQPWGQLLHGLGDKPGAVVGANVLRNATQDKQIAEHLDDINGF
jgi:hypothetical protein